MISVSADMRPPTSMPNTTRRALLRGPTNSGWVRYFLRRALSRTTPVDVLSSLMRRTVTMDSADDGGVHCELASTEQWEAIHDHLQPPSVCRLWFCEVQVTHHDILGDSPSCFAAHSGYRPLQSEPPPPQHARACTRCSVVAQFVDLAATPACVQRRRQWQSKTSQHHDSDKVRRNPSQEVCQELLTKPIQHPGQPVTSPALSGRLAVLVHLGRNHMLPTSVTSWLQCLRFHW